jgi:hypothetical protein
MDLTPPFRDYFEKTRLLKGRIQLCGFLMTWVFLSGGITGESSLPKRKMEALELMKPTLTATKHSCFIAKKKSAYRVLWNKLTSPRKPCYRPSVAQEPSKKRMSSVQAILEEHLILTPESLLLKQSALIKKRKGLTRIRKRWSTQRTIYLWMLVFNFWCRFKVDLINTHA